MQALQNCAMVADARAQGCQQLAGCFCFAEGLLERGAILSFLFPWGRPAASADKALCSAPHAKPCRDRVWGSGPTREPVALAARRARRGRAQLPAGPSTWGCRWGRGQDSEALSTGVLQANAAAQEGKSTYSAKIVSMQKFCHFRTNFFLRGGKKDFEQIQAEQ